MHKARPWAQEVGHRVDPRPQRRIHQVGVALRGLHLAVAQKLADHFQRGTTADQQGSEGVAQVVDAQIGQLGILLNFHPEPADFPHRLTDGLTGKQPRIAARDYQLALADDGDHFLRDRHTMDLALLGGRGRFRPDDIVEVELLEPRRPHLAHPGAGQHAHADDRCRAQIFGSIKNRRDPGQFFWTKEAFAGLFDAPVEPMCRIVGAPFPLDGQREHLAQHLARAVGPDRGGLEPLEFARAIIGLGLAGARATLCYEIEEPRNVGLGNLGHQLVAPDRFVHLSKHRSLVGGIVFREFWQVFGDVAGDHVLDARRSAKLLSRRQGVKALIDGAAQFLGTFACSGHAPIRPAPDGHAALPPGMAVVDGESSRARGLNPGGKADHLGIEDLIADPRLRLRIAQGFLIQFQSVDHVSGLLVPRHRRRAARLSSQSTVGGAEYRQRPELKWGGAIPVKKINGKGVEWRPAQPASAHAVLQNHVGASAFRDLPWNQRSVEVQASDRCYLPCTLIMVEPVNVGHGNQMAKDVYNAAELAAIADALADTSEGLTGSEIGYILSECGMQDVSPDLTKRKRLFNAFVASQNSRQDKTRILGFIRKAMKPPRYARQPDRYEPLRANVNRALAFVGLNIQSDGTLEVGEFARTLQEAERRALELRDDLATRNVHPDVLRFCRAELVADNYFHAVLEAVKSVAEKIRDMTGLTEDGSSLVDQAFGGSMPLLAINSLSTDSHRSEQKGFANLLRGTFSMFRNPAAHEARILWPISKEDAEDLLSLLSLVHRRLDVAFKP